MEHLNIWSQLSLYLACCYLPCLDGMKMMDSEHNLSYLPNSPHDRAPKKMLSKTCTSDVNSS
jgi:hypothetical protein